MRATRQQQHQQRGVDDEHSARIRLEPVSVDQQADVHERAERDPFGERHAVHQPEVAATRRDSRPATNRLTSCTPSTSGSDCRNCGKYTRICGPPKRSRYAL